VRKAGNELEEIFRKSWASHDIESKLQTGKAELTREEKMMKECDKIVHFLKKHKYAQPFLKPVTADILQNPELWAKYQDVIKEPMDISTLANKLRRRKFKDIDEFKDACHLIFDNCFKFNFPGDPVHKAGQHLKSGFKKRWRKLEEKFGIERLKPEAEAWKRVEGIVGKIAEQRPLHLLQSPRGQNQRARLLRCDQAADRSRGDPSQGSGQRIRQPR